MTTGVVGMSTAGAAGSLSQILATDINTAPGIKLDNHRQQLLGSVLDLFSGHPSLYKLSFWRQDAHFEDPITTAKGYDAYAAQWYGLAAMFTSTTKKHEVTKSDESNFEFDLEQEYKSAGITKLMKSKIVIELDGEGKIQHLTDKWNGEDMPTSMVATWARKANAATVPKFVSVPKNEHEEAEKKKGEL